MVRGGIRARDRLSVEVGGEIGTLSGGEGAVDEAQVVV